MKKIEHAVITGLLGSRVIGPSGEELGVVTEVLVDAASREPTFVEVELGDAARQPGRALVPTAGLQLGTGTVRSPYSRATLTAAPGSAERLSPEDEARVLAHYEGQPRPSAGDAAKEDTGSSDSAGVESPAQESGSATTQAQDGRPAADAVEHAPGTEAQEEGTAVAESRAGAVDETPLARQGSRTAGGTGIADGETAVGPAEDENTQQPRGEPEQG